MNISSGKMLNRVQRAAAGIALMVAAASLGACGGVDGVELNGKIFDALGVSGDPFAKKDEPKTQARAPLVLPPDTSKLPEPGSAPGPGSPLTTGAVNPQWPRDSEAQKMADANARKAAQEKYCQDGNWKQKAVKDEIRADSGPDGQCGGSIFSVIGNSLFGSGKE